MTILGIETSCDETAAGIITVDEKTKQITLLANITATSLALHAKTGGIIPEIAARGQIKCITPVITEALKTGLGFTYVPKKKIIPPIDTIAVTYGPGLVGSLLVGIEAAKTLSYLWNKPIIPVNHMLGHIYANWIKNPNIQFPAIALVVSGGHTDLLEIIDHHTIHVLGGTRDDAAGEAFDKIGRLLGLKYPAGPMIEKLAKNGDPKRFVFPRPLVGSGDLDFSFSGLKTAVLREVTKINTLDEQTVADIARGAQDAITSVLTKKTLTAIEKTHAKTILLSGGVSANQALRERFEQSINDQGLQIKIVAPPLSLCTDNGAMIASAAYFTGKPIPWQNIQADPTLYY